MYLLEMNINHSLFLTVKILTLLDITDFARGEETRILHCGRFQNIFFSLLPPPPSGYCCFGNAGYLAAPHCDNHC